MSHYDFLFKKSFSPTNTTVTKDTTKGNITNKNINLTLLITHPHNGPQGPLTLEEKKYHRDNNLCDYCAGDNHITVNCEQLKTTNTHKLALTTTTNTPA